VFQWCTARCLLCNSAGPLSLLQTYNICSGAETCPIRAYELSCAAVINQSWCQIALLAKIMMQRYPKLQRCSKTYVHPQLPVVKLAKYHRTLNAKWNVAQTKPHDCVSVDITIMNSNVNNRLVFGWVNKLDDYWSDDFGALIQISWGNNVTEKIKFKRFHRYKKVGVLSLPLTQWFNNDGAVTII